MVRVALLVSALLAQGALAASPDNLDSLVANNAQARAVLGLVLQRVDSTGPFRSRSPYTSGFSRPKSFHFHRSKGLGISDATRKQVAGILNGILGNLMKQKAALPQVAQEIVKKFSLDGNATAEVTEALQSVYTDVEPSPSNGTTQSALKAALSPDRVRNVVVAKAENATGKIPKLTRNKAQQRAKDFKDKMGDHIQGMHSALHDHQKKEQEAQAYERNLIARASEEAERQKAEAERQKAEEEAAQAAKEKAEREKLLEESKQKAIKEAAARSEAKKAVSSFRDQQRKGRENAVAGTRQAAISQPVRAQRQQVKSSAASVGASVFAMLASLVLAQA